MTDLASTLLAGGQGALQGLATGGPIGALIGAVTGLLPGIEDALFGRNAPAVQAAVTQVVATVTGVAAPTAQDVAGLSPDQQAQLRVQLAQIAAADRQAVRAQEMADQAAILKDIADARQQTIALASTKSPIQWAAPIVSFVVLFTFGTVMLLAFTRSLPSGSETLLNMLLGSLAAMTTSVVSYWVGSSAGSQQKTDLLYRSTPAMPASAGANG